MRNDKKLSCNLTLVAITLAASCFSFSASAASPDECAIWLCLPTGFTTGCDGAKSAFKNRIKRMKSPLPSFSSCLVNSGNTTGTSDSFTAKNGVAAYIPSYKYCVKYGRQFKDYECIAWEETKPEYRKDTVCRFGGKDQTRTPAHCSRTYRYAEVYRNGILYGETHYY